MRRLVLSVALALAAVGCEGPGDVCRCLAMACTGDVCGWAIRIAGDQELHRLEPAEGSTTACGIEIGPGDEVMNGDDAEDELRAGAGHGPCWRTEN